MKRKFKKLLGMVTAFALILGMGVCVQAAELVLDGDDAGGSSFIGEFSASGAEYKYLGYVTTKGATSEYKIMEITYTGDISTLRIEFNREDDSLEGPYWFDKQDQTKYFKTKSGKDITLNADKEKTIKIDLEATGIDIGEFVGMHLHYLGPEKQDGSFEIIDAKLISDGPGAEDETEESSVVETDASEVTEEATSMIVSTGTEGTAGGSVEATNNNFPIWPIVVAVVVAGGVVAGATFVLSKNLKKEK